jgi:hypothetical protein
MKKLKNEIYELEWREHSSYYTEGEAKTKSVRLGFMISKPTKVVYDPITERYWIKIGCNPYSLKINHTLDV